MGEPTINEKRPDAHVIVYGDSAPITDAEWRCARRAWTPLYTADVLRSLDGVPR